MAEKWIQKATASIKKREQKVNVLLSLNLDALAKLKLLLRHLRKWLNRKGK